MNDFIEEGLKVGDRLYSLTQGWGEVKRIGEGTYPIVMDFQLTLQTCITANGKIFEADAFQSLFWDEPKFEIPAKPKREVVKEIDVFVNYNPGTGSCEAFKDPSDATDRLSVGEINIKGKLTFTIIE